MGLWGAQRVAMWGPTTWVTGVRPSPLLGPLCNPSNRPWRLQVGVTPGGGPQVPHTPRGLLGGLWVAWEAALPLKSPLVASLIAKGTVPPGPSPDQSWVTGCAGCCLACRGVANGGSPPPPPRAYEARGAQKSDPAPRKQPGAMGCHHA